ncbi:hypothetical protein TPHA_0G00470 [Tetrapisispora phaffii CBS 4417]|uniref:rRNA adenine N(6)-methyltransferase n=1 Tax=Tetrapisispora phaffii (strain ATCC 24235 / CBS 4417 / NBRC 1672 / NRRL Y-8282 / UCD 70-5) TaxID=1071381 RepID=G8BVF5_TETPH|nr:hypothetical protein TPHA_0G00470 [Tetrapisispora phaffii CBS 4417]CCE63883.1 hypothetical protein TPHA_0G00470 [Tetrapisispora phaffii CBS 4417]
MSLTVPTLESLSSIKKFYSFKYMLNSDIHEKIFNKLKLEKVYSDFSNKVDVIDLYPGPAQQSVMFNNKYKPRNHILMESRLVYHRHLINNYQQSPFIIYKKDPYEWSSYTDLIDKEKIITPIKQDRTHVNDSLLLIANLTNPNSEALMMQWLSCVGNGNWLQRFGLVKMLIWLPTSTAIKLLACPTDKSRSKCSLLTEALTDTNLVATMNSKDINLFNKKIIDKCDPILFDSKDVLPDKSCSISLLEVTPKQTTIDFDYWDYVTKHLMILKGTTLRNCVESLGHGARDYFERAIKDQSMLDRCPGELTIEEINYLVDLFYKWPYKPDIYMDFIDIFQDSNS